MNEAPLQSKSFPGFQPSKRVYFPEHMKWYICIHKKGSDGAGWTISAIIRHHESLSQLEDHINNIKQHLIKEEASKLKKIDSPALIRFFLKEDKELFETTICHEPSLKTYGETILYMFLKMVIISLILSITPALFIFLIGSYYSVPTLVGDMGLLHSYYYATTSFFLIFFIIYVTISQMESPLTWVQSLKWNVFSKIRKRNFK